MQNLLQFVKENTLTLEKNLLYYLKVKLWQEIAAKFISDPFLFEEIFIGIFCDLCDMWPICKAFKRQSHPSHAREKAFHSVTFIQNGAPPHFLPSFTTILRPFEYVRVLNRCFQQDWLPRSPNLTAFGDLLYVYLKMHVSRYRAMSVIKLKIVCTITFKTYSSLNGFLTAMQRYFTSIHGNTCKLCVSFSKVVILGHGLLLFSEL